MIENLNTAKRVLERKRDDCLAFIVGNGINRHAYSSTKNVSWEDMLLYLWSKVSGKTISTISEGVSYTEFYNIVGLEGIDIDGLRKAVVEYTDSNYKPARYHHWLCKKLQKWDVPVLTTNFDRSLESELNMYKLYKEEGKKRGFTDMYPWNVYFSQKRINNPLDGFAVWHINGMTKYRRSLKLGLSEYINQTARARDFIHSDEKVMDFDKKNRPYWNGYNTWLHVIFNASLCFCGLELDVNETFLRWLLLERARYFKKFPSRRKEGWFVCCNRDKMTEGKRFFLENTGIEIIRLRDYDEVYEGLFEI